MELIKCAGIHVEGDSISRTHRKMPVARSAYLRSKKRLIEDEIGTAGWTDEVEFGDVIRHVVVVDQWHGALRASTALNCR